MKELLVGTEAGLFVLDEVDGNWAVAARFLDGVEINRVVREEAGTILAATRERGLVRIDVERGSVTPLGTTTLPKTVRSIAISPANPSVIYAGTEPAGIFCSRDGGTTWSEDPHVARLRELRNWQYPGTTDSHIRDIAIDRQDPQCIYAAVQIGGFLRTIDGGAHWEDMVVDIDPDVHAILQHPADPNVLFAVCGGGGAWPKPPAQAADPPYPHGRPLYKSTDRGMTWTSISDGLSRSYGVPIAALREDRLVLLAGVAGGTPPRWAGRPEKADASLIVSEDEGLTWRPVADGLPAPFPTMLEAIEVDRQRERVYLGTGGEGTKWMAAADSTPRSGEVYYSQPNGTWTHVPITFPLIMTLSASRASEKSFA